MTPNAQTYIQALSLQAHPEGGFFRETYRSKCVVTVSLDDLADMVHRNISTGILFLLEEGNFSAFHQIKSDEMWHFYAGQSLELLEITDSGELLCTRLDPNGANLSTVHRPSGLAMRSLQAVQVSSGRIIGVVFSGLNFEV